ncbi:hypothetical protein AVEN_52001-1 [Araneus ventricosus]|uniref:Uncharacterized protein n=1 Tax=Araneus ventricosus TaxID=182803 RepID=A0A4Y2CGE4_ARAVE|nr:hypothetical protein AVEN_52001-1 [Araneus ventricosus]
MCHTMRPIYVAPILKRSATREQSQTVTVVCLKGQRPYHAESTGSHLITAVKQHWVQSVGTWEGDILGTLHAVGILNLSYVYSTGLVAVMASGMGRCSVCLHVIVSGEILLCQEPFQVLEQMVIAESKIGNYRWDGQTLPRGTSATDVVCRVIHEGEWLFSWGTMTSVHGCGIVSQ